MYPRVQWQVVPQNKPSTSRVILDNHKCQPVILYRQIITTYVSNIFPVENVHSAASIAWNLQMHPRVHHVQWQAVPQNKPSASRVILNNHKCQPAILHRQIMMTYAIYIFLVENVYSAAAIAWNFQNISTCAVAGGAPEQAIRTPCNSEQPQVPTSNPLQADYNDICK